MALAARLRGARVYLAIEGGHEDVVHAALGAGLDMVQLRDKDADDDTILRAAVELRELCRAHGALFVVNDRPDLALECGADAVRLGQDDAPIAAVRAGVGDR